MKQMQDKPMFPSVSSKSRWVGEWTKIMKTSAVRIAFISVDLLKWGMRKTTEVFIYEIEGILGLCCFQFAEIWCKSENNIKISGTMEKLLIWE